MKKLEMEQAAEREEFERKVSKIILSQTVPHVPCDVFLLNSTINLDKSNGKIGEYELLKSSTNVL